MTDDINEVLETTRTMVLSTISVDGTPWGTPLRFTFDGANIVWDNSPGSVHLANLLRDGRCFITIVNFDEEHSRAIYIKTLAKKLPADEAKKARKLLEKWGETDLENEAIFMAPMGEMSRVKPDTEKENGSLRAYFEYKEEKK
jgi:nitroimidazol reductase NimA-like FMN-containing flavoprotein (pyridoxamine 5'-phosphate oxidase superfamily)